VFWLFGLGRGGARKYLYLRLALLAALLVAVFVLHLSGTALVVMRVARVALVIVVLLVARGLRMRGARRSELAAGESDQSTDLEGG
jgi:hypothetical protein